MSILFPFSPERIDGVSLQLEPLTVEHYVELRKAANHESLWDYMPMKAHGKFFDDWFIETLAKHRAGTQLTYVIRKNKENQAILGCHSYYDIDINHKRLEIGYSWLTPASWGNVFLHESLWFLLCNAFECWQINRIQLAADSQNKRSCNILRKLGAVKEGLLREHMIHHNGLITDTVVYSILAREWPSVKRVLEKRLHWSD